MYQHQPTNSGGSYTIENNERLASVEQIMARTRVALMTESIIKMKQTLNLDASMPYSTIADRAEHNMPAADNPYAASVASSSAGVGDASSVEQQHGPQDPKVAFGELAYSPSATENVAYLQALQGEEVAAPGEPGQKPALASGGGTDEVPELLARIQSIHDVADAQNPKDWGLAA